MKNKGFSDTKEIWQVSDNLYTVW